MIAFNFIWNMLMYLKKREKQKETVTKFKKYIIKIKSINYNILENLKYFLFYRLF